MRLAILALFLSALCAAAALASRPRALPLCALAALALAALALMVAVLSHRCSPFPPDAVLVPLDGVPPDACVAFYGPGPCREHGHTVVGSTDAVAGPPPASWRGAVR